MSEACLLLIAHIVV